MDESRKSFFRLTLTALVLLGVYLWWSSPLIVTVTGTGEVKVPAQAATVSFQITETNPSPVVAVTNLQGKADGMRALLVQNGVEEQEIIQSQPRVVPAVLAGQTGGGFTATMSMGGKTSNVAVASQLSAALYEKGAALVSQPVLSVDDATKLEQEAFEIALKEAKKKATAVAWKNLKFIKKMAGINQAGSGGAGTVTSKGGEGVDTADGVVPPSSDSLTISSVVEVTYRMW